MKIELKVLNPEFYTRSKEQMLSYPNDEIYDLPFYATSGSAAMDLVCTEDVTIYPGQIKAIPTGLALWIGSNKAGYFNNYLFSVAGLILPRSGLGTKGLVLANTVGLIDSDYQGELIVQAWNRSDVLEEIFETNIVRFTKAGLLPSNTIELKAGDRFAQIMFVPIIKANWEIVTEFSNNTQRGLSGFGSTGK